jgi:hypothetical protein
MTPDRINSTGQPVIKSEKLINNLRSGNSYDRVKTGSLSAMMVERLIASSGGASHLELEALGDGNYQLTASFPWDVVNGSQSEAPINSHELDESMEKVKWFQSDVMLAQLGAIFGGTAGGAGAMNFLKAAVSSYQALTVKNTAAQTEAEAAFSATYSSGQLALMLNLFRGVAYQGWEEADQTKIVYHRRLTAASFKQVQASFTGAGQIWTTSEVIAFEQTPATWWFQLPSSLLWFKSYPRVLTVAGQKTELTFSYTAGNTFWNGLCSAYASASLQAF